MENLDLVGGRYLIAVGEKPRGGGFSVVKKAFNIASGEAVAVKFITGAGDEILRKVFEREESLLRRSKHPNIVRFIDSGVDDTDTQYLVLEWAERTIADLLDEGEPLAWEPFVREVLRPIADALAYLHSQAIEHRDIKPINVLADDSGVPLLADFGIAKLQQAKPDTSLTLANLGSPLWAPPEYASAAPYLRDVFALGVLLVYGMSPASQRPAEFYQLQSALELIDIPAELRELIRSSVDVSPEARPRNAIEFLRRLDRAVEAQAPPVARTAVAFALTRAARNQIVGDDGFPDRAEAILLKDLEEENHASFRWDSETGRFDPTVIFLVGATLMLTLKLDETNAGLLVTGAKRPDYDILERSRSGALRTDKFVSWSIASGRAPSGSAIEVLLGRLTLHHESADAGGTLEDASSELLSAWRRSLDARESIETDRIGVLEFEESKRRNAKETEFTLLEEQEADLVGSEWQIVDPSGRPAMRGHVVQQSGTSLFIRWQWGDGNVPSNRRQLHPYLGPSQTALSRQRDALRQIEAGSTYNPDLLGLVSAPETALPPALVDSIDWVSDLDDSKQAAVRAAVGLQDCMIVAGPPGTGKTRFIAETVAQTLHRKASARILIVSQTHVAIDNALERMVQTGVTNIVRIGRRDDERVAESSRALLLDEQLEIWAQTARTKAETYFDERAAAAGISRAHLRAVMHLEEFISIQRNRRYLESRIPISEDSPTANRIDLVDDSLDLRKKIDDATKREGIALEAARNLLAGDHELAVTLTVETAAQAVADLISRSEHSAELLDLLRLQADWLQRISSDDRLAAIFLGSSQVIAGTCLGFIGHKAVRDLTFDLCIIDEASKATSTEALVPLVRSSKFILVGDENQLPPLDEDLLRDSETLAANNLTQEFVKETLFMRLSRDLPAANRFLLTDQYRMIAPIGNLISECFYDGALRSPLREGVQGYASFGREVLWLDTSTFQGRRENFDPRSSGSYMNRFEARVAIERLATIDSAIELGLIPKAPANTKYSVLLIAPYRSQLDELARQLTRAKPKHLRVEVESVDAVQGREADFAIFSVTRSNAEGRLGFLGADYWRRINVALSRARFGLTVVGDADFCARQPGGLKRVLTHIRANRVECEVRKADVPN